MLIISKLQPSIESRVRKQVSVAELYREENEVGKIKMKAESKNNEQSVNCEYIS